MNKPLRILILGGGTAGWMTANLFAKRWSKDQVDITLVESPDIGIIGVGEGSTPTLKRFFELIEVPEKDWMPECAATYKLNIRFDGWSQKNGFGAYSHPFVSKIDTFTLRAFSVNCRTRRLGLDTHVNPEDFLINGVLAKQGKGPQCPQHFPFELDYGYHFDSGLLGEFLAKLAIKRGVKRIKAHVESVHHHLSGHIQSLHTNQVGNIEADFFVDCSGFGGRLMQQALDVQYLSYKNNLFNDAAVVVPTDISESLPVETRATALSSGWCWRIPLTHRFGNGYVYSSDFLNAEQAENELRQHLELGDSDVSCRHLKMRTGRLAKQWSHNCLAIGLSQGFVEPLEATALHSVQVSIETFIEYFDKSGFTNRNQNDYNQFVSARFDNIRDYIVAHYKLNHRSGAYWRANRDNNNTPESLLKLLDAWFRGKDLDAWLTDKSQNTPFLSPSWHCLLSGYGHYPPLSANQPGQGDLYKDQHVSDFLDRCALNFKEHKQNLAALTV